MLRDRRRSPALLLRHGRRERLRERLRSTHKLRLERLKLLAEVGLELLYAAVELVGVLLLARS